MRFLLITTLLLCGCSKVGMESKKADRSMPAAARNGAVDSEKPLPDSATLKRKIVYTYEVELGVDDFTSIPKKVEDLVAKFGGRVASSNVYGSPGRRRRGQWTLRVPENRSSEFLAALEGLGEAGHVGCDSQDVTEEYYDVQARLENKQRTRDRLLKHLEDPAGKKSDTIEIEREIDRVQEKIEQMQGRLKMLDNLTAMTTVNLSVEEMKYFDPKGAATYRTRLGRAWGNSISSLNTAAQGFSIGAIAALPWIGIFSVPVIGAWLLLRARRKRRNRG